MTNNPDILRMRSDRRIDPNSTASKPLPSRETRSSTPTELDLTGSSQQMPLLTLKLLHPLSLARKNRPLANAGKRKKNGGR